MQEKNLEKNKLKYFPVTSFSIIMGLSGFTITLSKFYHLEWLPEWPYLSLLTLTTILFLGFLAAYLLKLAHYPEEVIADYKHKVRMNFVPTISISFLLLSIAFLGYYPLLSGPLWLIGVSIHTILTFHIISIWITHDFEIHHFNPAWFIPVVGNMLIPVAGVIFAPTEISAFYFVSGVFFWIIMSTIIIYRLIFHKTMPQKFMPTLFILLAPPAIGFISYMRLNMSYDIISQAFLFLTFFIFILLVFLIKQYKNTPFFLSWWAYTFPLASFTIASTIAYQVTKFGIFKFIAWFGIIILALVISVVTIYTIKYIKKEEICIKED